jgi:hypothetical protein
MEDTSNEASALATLNMLEERLHRLEFLLHGSSNAVGIPDPAPARATQDDTVSTRLAGLESGLHRLSSKHGLVKDILDMRENPGRINPTIVLILCEDARYRDIFLPAANPRPPSTLDGSTIQSIVLAHASSFPETLSRLTSVRDLPIPPASASADLVALQPRLEKVQEVQRSQIREVAELRARSARLLERWLEVGVVGQGEVWAEWEERVRAVERGVRRIEVAREKQGS